MWVLVNGIIEKMLLMAEGIGVSGFFVLCVGGSMRSLLMVNCNEKPRNLYKSRLPGFRGA